MIKEHSCLARSAERLVHGHDWPNFSESTTPVWGVLEMLDLFTCLFRSLRRDFWEIRAQSGQSHLPTRGGGACLSPSGMWIAGDLVTPFARWVPPRVRQLWTNYFRYDFGQTVLVQVSPPFGCPKDPSVLKIVRRPNPYCFATAVAFQYPYRCPASVS